MSIVHNMKKSEGWEKPVKFRRSTYQRYLKMKASGIEFPIAPYIIGKPPPIKKMPKLGVKGAKIVRDAPIASPTFYPGEMTPFVWNKVFYNQVRLPNDAFDKAFNLEKPILVYVYNTLPADGKINDMKAFEEKILSDDTVFDFIEENFTLIKAACKTPVKLKKFDKAKALERFKKQLTDEKLTETEQEQLELDKVRKQLEKENLPSDLIDYGSFQKIRKVLGLVTVDKRKEKEYKKRVFPETEIAAYSDKASLYICAFDGEIYFRVSTKATPADLLKMLKKAKNKK